MTIEERKLITGILLPGRLTFVFFLNKKLEYNFFRIMMHL